MASVCSSDHESDSYPDNEEITCARNYAGAAPSAINGRKFVDSTRSVLICAKHVLRLSSRIGSCISALTDRAEECENRNDESSDSEDNGNVLGDEEEEELYDSSSIPKLQFRNDMWRACWNEGMKMAEVLKNKGKMATTTGVSREGKLFCSIEETLYLAEKGALSLSESDDLVPLTDLYKRISGEACGCSWELFEAYRHLKSLGYIVGRHNAPWTLNSKKKLNQSSVLEAVIAENSPFIEGLELDFSALALDERADPGELEPDFDVFLPNSKFKKSLPGNPCFRLHVCRGHPPSKHDIEILKSKCGGIPLKICHVDHGRVSYLSFNEAELEELP